MSLRSSPIITSSMFESPLYGLTGLGETDNIFLLGHADGLDLNSPYPVHDMNSALDLMGGDQNSPLAKGLLEAYYAGARDIWLVAIDRMENYEPDLSERDATYYQAHKDALATTYELLKDYDFGNIVVPLEAPVNSTIDFLTPLVNFCAQAFEVTGEIRIGIIGTRGNITSSLVTALEDDVRFDSYYGDLGKFVGVFAGDVVFSFRELAVTHSSSIAAAVAGQIASNRLDRGVTGQIVKNGQSISGPDISVEDISRMAEVGINSIKRTTAGMRGKSFQVAIQTDNTLAADGSDFWSLLQMRLTSRISSDIRRLGKRFIGRIGYETFKKDLDTYLISLLKNNSVKQYNVNVDKIYDNGLKILVNLSFQPYFGIREINVPILIGPYQGG